jgi:hypothetical protein
VDRRCPLLKVDLGFAPVGNPDNPESPADRIAGISRPFLQSLTIDSIQPARPAVHPRLDTLRSRAGLGAFTRLS